MCAAATDGNLQSCPVLHTGLAGSVFDATNLQAVVIAFDMPHAADPRNLHPADNLVIGVIAVLVNKQLVESSLALLA